jgi:hypothetical protein
MISISFGFDARKKSTWLKVDGFVSAEWEKGKAKAKVLKISLPFPLKKQKSKLFGILPVKLKYLKGIFSFLKESKMKKVEGTLSLPDPMINGVLYGWMSALQTRGPDRKINLTVNFSGENWLKGELTISLRTVWRHFRSWMYPLIREMRARNRSKEVSDNGSH